MNYKPQTFTSPLPLAGLLFSLLTAGLAVHSVTAVFADESPATAARATDDQPTSVSQDDVPAATQLMADVREKLDSLDSLSCDLHETILLSGMKISAAGRYLQTSGNRFRLEFRLMPAVGASNQNAEPVKLESDIPDDAVREARGALTQVSDGAVLYSYIENGTDIRVTRRNISDVLKAAAEVSNYEESRAVQDLGLGGLKTLFARFENTMDFSKVRREIVGGMQLLVVNGRWNARIRKDLFQLPEDVDVIPQEFIPDYVRIYIDEATRLPRRIQYLKRSQNPEQKQVRPIVTLDLRQIVLNEKLDDSLFVFETPEGVVEEDVTEQTLQEIRSGLGASSTPQQSDLPQQTPAIP